MKEFSIQASIAFFLLALAVWAVTACTRINELLGLRDDNIFEEAIEEFIEYETGIDIDLTPQSHELAC